MSSLVEKIVDAINSQPRNISSFEELKNIRTMKVWKDGKLLGEGEVGTLPYGAGSVVRINGKVFFADGHTPFDSEGVNLCRSTTFRHDAEVQFPLTVEYSD